jgi:hypothetical protein
VNNTATVASSATTIELTETVLRMDALIVAAKQHITLFDAATGARFTGFRAAAECRASLRAGGTALARR